MIDALKTRVEKKNIPSDSVQRRTGYSTVYGTSNTFIAEATQLGNSGLFIFHHFIALRFSQHILNRQFSQLFNDPSIYEWETLIRLSTSATLSDVLHGVCFRWMKYLAALKFPHGHGDHEERVSNSVTYATHAIIIIPGKSPLF